jgi:hypothetical protein
MKRILGAAAASGIGALGAVGLMSAAPAQADDCSSFRVLQGRFVCIAVGQAGTFIDSVNPVNQINTFLHGTDEVPGDPSTNDGLGILDQPKTFVNSVKTFLSGPTLG